MHASLTRELAGKVAIITGGSRGIGRAIAEAFAMAGAAVAVTARSAADLAETVAVIERTGGRAIALPADVTDQRAVEATVAETERRLGSVDILVNNAGVEGPVGPLWAVDLRAWQDCLEVNLIGSVLCARAVLAGMVTRRRGCIINIASGSGLQAAPYQSAYTVSKAALIRLAETLAAETHEHGVSVFAVGPGAVLTSMADRGRASADFARWIPHFIPRIEAHATPAERPAALCVLLASGQADALSGRFVSVAMDVPALVQRAAEIQRDELYTMRLRTAPVRF
ncbi:MAG: SDR family NAD(P)-dependent oxidoreductase [Dehalococcoidia bacterium]